MSEGQSMQVDLMGELQKRLDAALARVEELEQELRVTDVRLFQAERLAKNAAAETEQLRTTIDQRTHEQIRQLESTIAALKAGWVSASTPPSDGRLVLTVRRGFDPQIAVYRPDVMEAFPWRSDHNINVAAPVPEWWMELPKHPSAEAAKGGDQA